VRRQAGRKQRPSLRAGEKAAPPHGRKSYFKIEKKKTKQERRKKERRMDKRCGGGRRSGCPKKNTRTWGDKINSKKKKSIKNSRLGEKWD